ncbi:hypothetical protein TSUD_59870 [Trifolium subterraneum]|uniref:SET domain-containing protein n=1 Tax=Trifolium subterraneum TaxID=3900 RepID=A0A2Z6N5L1_TRISU|nr:hypothetical protein TSUD_59870 [Trifolium subterraneum]
MATIFSGGSVSPFLFHSNKGMISFTPKSPILHLKRPISAKSVASIGTETSLSPAVQTFWKWLKDEGVITAKTPVKASVVPEGLGLVALKDISRNDVVLQVPKRLWINPDAVEASEIGKVCSELKPWLSVILFLIRERSRSDSIWKHYFGTQLLNTTLSVKEYVKNECLKLEKEIILPNKRLFPSPVTLDDFFWAFGILRSRAFSRLRNENLVIIPFADLINHSDRVTTTDHAYEVTGAAGLFSWDYLFSIRSPLSVKAGEQVYIQYDLNKSNAEMALDYGFIEPNVDRHAYTLTLDISESDPFFDDKLDVAESNGFAQTAYFDIFYNRPIPPGLLPYLRLVALGGTDAFLLESLFRDSIWGHLELPVSRDNEELLCKAVRDACKSALAGYHTTIEQDRKLKEENLDYRLAIAVGVREGEKMVLQQIDEIFEQKESELDQLEYYQERRLKDLGLCGESGDVLGDLAKFF